MQKVALCVEVHRDADATHTVFQLDPPCLFHGAETKHLRIIEAKRSNKRQIIADNGSWVAITNLGEVLTLDAYLLRYYGYQEPLVSQLRRSRGQWDDLERPPEEVPIELGRIWASLDDVQRLLVAWMADQVGKVQAELAEREQAVYDDGEDW